MFSSFLQFFNAHNHQGPKRRSRLGQCSTTPKQSSTSLTPTSVREDYVFVESETVLRIGWPSTSGADSMLQEPEPQSNYSLSLTHSPELHRAGGSCSDMFSPQSDSLELDSDWPTTPNTASCSSLGSGMRSTCTSQRGSMGSNKSVRFAPFADVRTFEHEVWEPRGMAEIKYPRHSLVQSDDLLNRLFLSHKPPKLGA